MAQNQRGGTAGRHRAGAGNDRTDYRTEREYGNTAGGYQQTRGRERLGKSETESYVYGNTARELSIQRQLEEAPKNHGLSHRTRKNRDKAKHMSLGYVAFLLAASVMAGAILMNYVQLQSDMTKLANQVAKKESELNRLKLSNDEEYSRITNSIDLEEIRRIAIGELGMTYAKEGQIESYSSEGNDYMRRAGED